MKNIRLLLILFAFITVFSACSKDDEKPATTEQKVIGKWNVKRSSYKSYENNKLEYSSEELGVSGEYLEFNSNKTYVALVDGYLTSGSYQILNDGNMTITIDGDAITASIDKLESKLFTFTMTDTYEDDLDNITYKEVTTFELTK